MSAANVLVRFGAKLNLNMARFSRCYQNSFVIWKLIENNCKSRLHLLNFMSYLIMRKKILLQILLSLICMLQSFCLTSPRNCSCHRFLCNPGWWTTVWNNYSSSRFKKTFWVSRKTFQNILQPIRRRLAKETINEEPVSPEKRLAVCLYRLAREDYYHALSQMSGLGIATVCNMVTEVFQAIVESCGQDM